jgi:non-heme chloroperoxidase
MKLRTLNGRILCAILLKDLRSLYPLLLLTTMLFGIDVLIVRMELMPAWGMIRQALLALAGAITIFALIQTDPPVSLVDDWLCRPVPRAELITAKLLFVVAVFYLSRVTATLIVDPILGASWSETLQEAFLLDDVLWLVLLPVLLFTAMVTRTIIQGIGVVLGILICMFVVPTPFVSAPGPLEPAIGDALFYVGLGWLVLAPGILLPLLLLAPGIWLLYWRRNTRAARMLLASGVLIAVMLALLPTWLAPWQPVHAVQKALSPPAVQVDSSALYLRHPQACFPAAFTKDLATEHAFTAARQMAGVDGWNEEMLRDSGAKSVAFLTAIEPRRLPQDTRLAVPYVQANYRAAAGESPLYSLRPTSYYGGGSMDGLSRAWVLPEHALHRLMKEPAVELELRYSLVLLQAKHFSLALDGKRHSLPGLGFCSAELDTTAYRIDVDCFSGFNGPAQISAELADIPASRVYGPADFSPRWLRWPFGSRVALTVWRPYLTNSQHITVTAWTLADYVDESLVLPGILGDDTNTCPLPGGDQPVFQQALWRDTAPHEVMSIRIHEGVQLEVLDFGGKGSPVVLLPGLGATAHSFDELAPLLAQKHRVIAITRRGTGKSSKPDYGFDTAQLSSDVLGVMDTLQLGKVLLVGHSIAGEELTWLGGHHPERFSGLVYLDAAYDRSGKDWQQRELYDRLPPEPPLPPEAQRNYEAMTKLLIERGHVRLPEGELIAGFNAGEPFLAGTPTSDVRTRQAITAQIARPDYAAVKVPALAVYAIADPQTPLPPWYDGNDSELMATLREIGRITYETQRRNIEMFRRCVAGGQVLELPKARHYLIQSNQTEVLEAIENFAAVRTSP